MMRSLIGPPAAPGSRQFAAFRAALGIYLLVHFVALIPHAEELYGARGMLADPRLNPTSAFIPAVGWIFDSPGAVQLLLGGLSATSLLLAMGVARHAAALTLWIGLVMLLLRNNLTSNVSLPYVGWMLLSTLAVPRGEAWTPWAGRSGWRFPKHLIAGAWMLFGVSYSFSGLYKLRAPEWREGDALLQIAQQPITYTQASWVMQALPDWMLQGATWSALALEVSCAPLALLAATRGSVWLGLTGMQICLLATMQISEVSLGLLLFHALLFDPGWLDSWRRRPAHWAYFSRSSPRGSRRPGRFAAPRRSTRL